MLSGKKAYICSLLSASDAKGVSHNMDMARFYMEKMKVLYHCRTFASHTEKAASGRFRSWNNLQLIFAARLHTI